MFTKFAKIYAYFKKYSTLLLKLIYNYYNSYRDYMLYALAYLKVDLIPLVASIK